MRTGDRFHFNWAVPKGAGECYQIVIQTVDGSTAMSTTMRRNPSRGGLLQVKVGS